MPVTAQVEAPEVIILGTDGNEHVFPAGFDPKRAASIVRQQILIAANAKPLTEPDYYAGGVAKSIGDTITRTGHAVLSTMNPFNIASDFAGAVKAHATEVPGYNGPPLPPVKTQVKEALTPLSTPEGGGQAIGNLLLMAAAGRAPQVIDAARAKMYTGGQTLTDLANTVKEETAGAYHPVARTAQYGLHTLGKLLEHTGKAPIASIPDIADVVGGNPNWKSAIEAPPPSESVIEQGGRPVTVSGTDTPLYIQQQLQDEMLKRAASPTESRVYSPISGETRIPITPQPNIGNEVKTAQTRLEAAATPSGKRAVSSAQLSKYVPGITHKELEMLGLPDVPNTVLSPEQQTRLGIARELLRSYEANSASRLGKK